MRLGMMAYEALSGFNNYRFHRSLEAVAESLAYWVRRCRGSRHITECCTSYGLDADEICTEVVRTQDGSDPGAEPIRAEVQYVCRHEMVCTLEDLNRPPRRLSLLER